MIQEEQQAWDREGVRGGLIKETPKTVFVDPTDFSRHRDLNPSLWEQF